MHVRDFLFLFVLLTLIGCVSVNVGGPKAKRAEKVRFIAPPSPFREVANSQVDRFWLSDKTGQSISYLSECESADDPSLRDVFLSLRQSLTDSEIIGEEEMQFNNRAALKAQLKGYVDGVESVVEAMIFKKNNCLYVLTFIGVPDSFDEELAVYHRFRSGFVAP